jgi:uncharacterized protein involved in copper resistance
VGIRDFGFGYGNSEAGVIAGKEWRSDANGQSLEPSIVMHSTGIAKVAAQESVTTAAGTFDTFRVEANIRQVNGADQTKSSTVQETSWYAPIVNRWVKRKTEIRFEGRLRESRTEELTDYSRKPWAAPRSHSRAKTDLAAPSRAAFSARGPERVGLITRASRTGAVAPRGYGC